MKTKEVRKFPLATTVYLAGLGAVIACSSQVNGTPDGGTSSTSSTAGGSTTTGGSSSSGASTTSGTSSGSAGSSVTTTCSQPASPDGGFAPLIDFSKACGGDGGPNLACFGAYPTLYGGSFAFAPTTDSTVSDAGVGCTTFGTQSTFAATLDTTGKTWTLAGKVGGFSGGGLWIAPCVNVQGYTGIQFTVSGSIGISTDGGDAGASNQVQLQISQLSDWGVSTAGGTCLAADGGAGANCNPFTYNFSVPASPQVIQVPFSMLTAGAPVATFDPAHIIQVQWQLPWPCTGGTPYMASVVFQNVQFYK